MGIGLSDVAATMEGYLAAYHEAIRAVSSGNQHWSIADVALRSQVLEWPAASGHFYDAVVSTLTVADIIQ